MSGAVKTLNMTPNDRLVTLLQVKASFRENELPNDVRLWLRDEILKVAGYPQDTPPFEP